MLHDTFWIYDYHRWPPGTTTKWFLKHRYSSRWFHKFAWNWKNLQNAYWDLHKMLYWAFFLHVGLAKTVDHFVENLYYPKCRPNKFSADHFVDPGYRRLLCTYKKREHKYTPWIVTGMFVLLSFIYYVLFVVVLHISPHLLPTKQNILPITHCFISITYS